MNGKNKILIGCLALLLVLSVGYALFSETVTINGTATAKGDLELTITEANAEELYDMKDLGIINSSDISINDNIVTTNVTLGAPGSTKYFVIKIENTGTIPVKFKSIEDVSTEEYEEAANWFGAGKKNSDNTSFIGVEVYPDANYMYDYQNPTETYYESPDDSIYSSVLDPGECTYYAIEYIWAEKSTSQEEMSMNFSFKLNWEQIAAN